MRALQHISPWYYTPSKESEELVLLVLLNNGINLYQFHDAQSRYEYWKKNILSRQENIIFSKVINVEHFSNNE